MSDVAELQDLISAGVLSAKVVNAARELGISVHQCRIGEFDEGLCRRVVELCESYL